MFNILQPIIPMEPNPTILMVGVIINVFASKSKHISNGFSFVEDFRVLASFGKISLIP
jgi:hypothetical protein